MMTIFNTKSTQILLLALAVSAAACSGAENSAADVIETDTIEIGTIENDGMTEEQVKEQARYGNKKLAYILEKTATPTKWDPDGAEIDKFKHCVQRLKGNEVVVMATYQLHLDEIQFDLETAADAKANNYELSSSPMKLHSAELIDVCPSGAIATCDRGDVIEHYYTDAMWVLAEFEKSCGYSGSDIWTKSK